MNKLFPSEKVTIHGGYFDYFGQLCPEYVDNSLLMPVEATHYPMCISMNLFKGREHGITKEGLNAAKGHLEACERECAGVEDVSTLFSKRLNVSLNPQSADYEMKELRDEMVYRYLFRNIGMAYEPNWIAADLMGKYMKIAGCPEFDDLPPLEKVRRFSRAMYTITDFLGLCDRQFESMGIHSSMALLAMGVERAVLNAPLIHSFEEPKSYISPENHRPFRSYFGVLETKRDHYMRYMQGIEFLFQLAAIMRPRLAEAAENDGVLSEPAHAFSCSGSGAAKEIIVRDRNSGRVVSSINHDFFVEASAELGLSSDSAEDHADPSVTARLQERVEMVRDLIAESHAQDRASQSRQFVFREDTRVSGALPIRPATSRIGRNDLCSCGSGRKFKKCCLRN